jgi:hypothetical protein
MILHKKILVALCLIVVASCGPKRYGCGPRRCEVKVKVKLVPYFNTGNKKHPLVFENQAGVVSI